MIQNLVLISTILIFISCDDSVVFEKYKSFENQEWNTDSLLRFNYTITDTTSKYKIVLNVRHNVEYEYQNLFLFVHFNSLTDTIELVFSEKNGRLLGRGIGDIREVKTLLDSGKTYFNSKNKIIKIEQAMRYGAQEKIKKLKFIDAVGISVIKEQ